MMEEVVFFHRLSRTAIFCDLVQRHDPARITGWKGFLMRLDGLVGEHGSTPREWRATFLRRRRAREAELVRHLSTVDDPELRHALEALGRAVISRRAGKD